MFALERGVTVDEHSAALKLFEVIACINDRA